MFNTLEQLDSCAEYIESYNSARWNDSVEYFLISEAKPDFPRPLLKDPYNLAGSQIKQWIKTPPSQGKPWRCYLSSKIVVSGIGSLYFDNKFILDTDLVAPYWKREFFNESHTQAIREIDLPIKILESPCVCALSWGSNIYGHFLIDFLPKILAIKNYFGEDGDKFNILLRNDAPEWMKKILINNLNFSENQLLYFSPSKERVLLRRGIFPAYGYQNGVFQNKILDLFSDNFYQIPFPDSRDSKIFISREKLPEHRKKVRGCKNESELCKVAEYEFGYEIYNPELDDWSEQLRRFRSASTVVGLYGSGLHTSILADEKLTVGFVGSLNLVQCSIANFRHQPFAAFVEGVRLGQNFDVDLVNFRKFLRGIEVD